MKHVIIGGVAAGTKAAAKIKKLQPESEVTIFTEDTHIAYSECGFPYFIKGDFNDEEMLYARSVEEFERSGINIKLEHKCIKIMPDKKCILIKSKNGELVENYDKLLIATGAYPYNPPIKNSNLKNIFTLRKIEDALKIKKIAQNSTRAAIIGCGYIGIELLEAFLSLNLRCTVLEAQPIILSIFDDDIAKEILNQVRNDSWHRAEIITSDYVTEFFGDNEVTGLKTLGGKVIETDFVIVCAGIKPRVELAVDADIEIGETGAIKVNSKMETGVKDIYAAGDCAEKFHIVSKQPVWIPLGSTATKEGRCAALNMCGIEENFEGVLGSAVTKFFDYTMSLTGLTEREAISCGFNPVSAAITKDDKVSYMPDAKKIFIKLIADKDSHRILGAQSIGYGDADKRINAVTSALLCNSTVEDLLNNDLTYAPPFSTSIDALLTVSEQLKNKLNNIK